MTTAIIVYGMLACLAVGYVVGDMVRDSAAIRAARRERESFDAYVATITATLEKLAEEHRERVDALSTSQRLAWQEAETLEARCDRLEQTLAAVRGALRTKLGRKDERKAS